MTTSSKKLLTHQYNLLTPYTLGVFRNFITVSSNFTYLISDCSKGMLLSHILLNLEDRVTEQETEEGKEEFYRKKNVFLIDLKKKRYILDKYESIRIFGLNKKLKDASYFLNREEFLEMVSHDKIHELPLPKGNI